MTSLARWTSTDATTIVRRCNGSKIDDDVEVLSVEEAVTLSVLSFELFSILFSTAFDGLAEHDGKAFSDKF